MLGLMRMKWNAENAEVGERVAEGVVDGLLSSILGRWGGWFLSLGQKIPLALPQRSLRPPRFASSKKSNLPPSELTNPFEMQ